MGPWIFHLLWNLSLYCALSSHFVTEYSSEAQRIYVQE